MIKKIICPSMGSNCYVVTNEENKQAVIIDAGENGVDIYNQIESWGYTPVALLLTHGHFDHSGGAKDLQDLGVKVYIYKSEMDLTTNGQDMSSFFGFPYKPFTADVPLGEGSLEIAGLKFKVLYTPGHTNGSCCYIFENYIFSGDTLFYLSYGRFDLPTGSWRKLMDSLNKIFSLKGDYIVYPGHGGETKLSYERENNPCLGEWDD